MELYFILAQIVGLIALSLEIFRFQAKSSKSFFYFEPILAALYTLQFYLLSAPAAVATSAIGIVRGVCGIRFSEILIRKAVIFVFIPSYMICTYIVYQTPLDLLPGIALLCSSITFLIRDNRYWVARLYLLNTALWIIYSIPVEAYVHVLNGLLVFTSIAIGIFRHEKFYKKRFNNFMGRFAQKSPA
ncbi:MAG: YgjV family protein [Pseudomonadota bacterium]